jgi:hypothetical protein
MHRRERRASFGQRSSRGIALMLRRFSAFLLVAAAAGLVVFHGWLLFARLTSGNPLDPIAALRWGGAGLVLVSLFSLRRLGISLVRSRHAAIVWLLAALLHAGVAVPVPGATGPLRTPPGLLVALPAVSATVLTLVTALSLARRRPRAVGARRIPLTALWRIHVPCPAPTFDGFALCVAPRPPPL